MFRALYQRWLRQRRPLSRIVRRRWPGYRSLPLRLEVLEERILLDGSNDCFLEAVYRDLLHQPIDNQSLASWMPMLQLGVSRQAVVSQIENSTEYRTDLIDQLYSSYLHHPADPASLNACLTYLQGGGMIEGLEVGLLGTPEFFQSQGGGSAAGFLEALYEDVLGRPVDPLSEVVLGSMIESGVPTAEIAYFVVTSPEADIHFVENCYETYLHHPADLLGLIGYTSLLMLGAGQQNVLASIVGSPEYFALNQCGSEEETSSPLAPPPVSAPPPALAPPTPAPPATPPSPFCGFDPGLNGWTVSQTGGSTIGHGTVTVQNTEAVLREGDSLTTSLQKTFTIPNTPSVLQFSYDDLSFDTTSHSEIKDAFEASFVDANGKPLVQTIGSGKDSFFNITEGAAPSLAAGVTQANTDEGPTVSLNLAGLTAGTTGTLVLRLVNNDSDTNTSIHITCVELNAAPGEQQVFATPALVPSIPQQQINFAALTDVTPSAAVNYGQTSFNNDQTLLYTNLSVANSGSYDMRAPLLAAITQLSDPTVHIENPDGTLPDGTPYFDLSSLVQGGLLEPGQSTGSRQVTFLDPNRTPFHYEVKVLGELNQPPAFTSQPNTQGIPGVPYVYQATAADPDGDPLTFSVVAGPKGLTIDPTSGKATYNPQAGDLGNHAVTLRVDDGHGGSTEQTYTLGVIQAPPNRPPVFTSTPVVDANVNTPYTYQVMATDPDGTKPTDPTGETLTFSVVAGPKGLVIDPASGLITWTPTADQLGTNQVTVQVSDGRGGTATQTYSIGVLQQKGNDPPVIISTPVTTLAVGQTYQYPVKAVDADNDPLTYSLPVGPTGMKIDPSSGLITWNGPGTTGGSTGPAPTDGLTLTNTGAAAGFSLSDFVHGFPTSGPAGPLGIVFPDALGGQQALIADYQGDLRLFSTDSDGQTFASGQLLANYGVLNAFGLAQLNGKLYATQQGKGDVVQLNPDGTIAATIAQIQNATGIVADPTNGHLYVSGESGSSFLDTVFDVDPVARTATPFLTGLANPDGLALSPDGKTLYVALNTGNQLVGFDIASGQKVFTSGTILGIDGTAVGFGTLSGFIFANTNLGDVWEIPLNDPTNPVLIASGGGRGDFISVDPNDGSLLLTQSDEIVRLTPPTGASFAQDFKVTARVDDGRGGFDTQSYTLQAGDQPGGIEGTKFNDLNGNGSRDQIGGNPAPVTLNNVPGGADPYLAGMPTGSTADGGDTAPAQSPLLVSGLTLTAGSSLMFTTLAGQVNSNGPEGDGNFTNHTVGAQNGISDIVAPNNSLVGVFLGAGQPDATATPPTLDFSSTGNVPGGVDYTSLSPQLQQVFFIGDGRTSTGQVQQVVVPKGATRLFLGIMDSLGSQSNTGSYAVAVAPFDPTNGPQPITLTPIATNFNSVIHVDYYEPDNTLIASVNYGGGQPHNFEEIKADGSHVQFSNVSGFTDEVYMAIARSSDIGGFKPGDIFVGNGQDGQIARITDGGQTIVNPWVTLPGSGHGLFRGYLTFDRTGVFGGDLIAETDQGEVWRINAAGQATEIANTHSFLEGVEVIPNDPARYGPLAGTILATDEQSSGFYSITPDGKVTFYDVGIGGLEDARVIAANENFFGSDYGSGRILGIAANQLAPLVGDIIFTQEASGLFRMYWDGKAFQMQPLDYAPGSTTASQWEGSNLAPAGVAPLPPVPLEPGLPNWTIYLDLNHDGKLDPGDPIAVTDSLGHYSFTNLAPGTYTVAEVGQSGWRQTDPTGGEHTVTVLPGQVVSGVDFGNTQLNVSSGLRNPTFTTTAPTTATVGQLYRYDAAVSNPDGTALTFDLPAHPAGMGVDSTTGVVFWEPTADEVGHQTVVLRVQDSNGRVALQSFQVTVSPASSAPVITSAPPEQAVVGVTYQYRVKAQDAAGNPLTYTLDTGPAGMSIDATGLLTYTPTAAQLGTQHVHLTVDNGHGGQAVQQFDLNVVATAPNDPPAISSAPRTVVRLGSDYLYTVQASDPDGDALRYSLATAPAGMTIDASGVIHWTPTAAEFGPNAVRVIVTDARGLAAPAQNFTINVISQTVNHPPAITSTPPTAATLGHPFQYNATASDPDGDPVVWSLLQAPVGMSIDPTTGTVRWTPTADELGPQDVEVQAQDPLLATATQSFTVQVRSVDVPPVIVSEPPTTAVTGTAYTYAVQTADVENNPLTYSLPAAPAGMTIDANGIIHWTPTEDEIGTQAVLVQVDDGQGGTATQAYQVVVTDKAGNQAPAITSAAPLAATVGGAYKYQVAATDPDGDKVSFALISAPAGMTINTATGLVQWTPTAAELGSNLVTIQATDPAGAQGEQTFAITLNANQPPQITSTAPATVTAGLTYRYDVQANDPDGDHLTYALTSSPAGMTLDPSSGRLSWSPGISDIGSHHIVTAVTDDPGATVTQTFDLQVVADTEAPKVNVALSSSRVNVGSNVTVTVTATDDVSVSGITLTVGGTPEPLDSSGTATIQLSTIGLISVVGTATDPAGNVGTATATVRVIDPTETGGPTVQITGPATNTSVTGLTAITGTVTDPHLESYQVQYAPLDQVDLTDLANSTADWVTFAQGTTPVTNGTLGTFDPTLLTDDAYAIRVLAQNVNSNVTAQGIVLNVTGNLKLGDFTQTFTDLSIPLAGHSIEVDRTYDTKQASQSGDFGFGWTLGFQNADIHTTVAQNVGQGLFGPVNGPFKVGTKVYLTDPDGKRVGFTFNPVPVSIPIFGTFWKPAFTPDPGVLDQLDTLTDPSNPYADLYAKSADGTFSQPFSFFGPYSPTQFNLTTTDGTRYKYDQYQGLQQITDPNGNTITFTAAGITSSEGPAIVFKRDAQNRIAEIDDPAGKAIKYQYDANGNLAGVTDQNGLTTTLAYQSSPAHYLSTITNPLGQQIFAAHYDAQGRLQTIVDALGNTSSASYDPNSLTEKVADALGNVTTEVYDTNGNIIKKIDSLGNTTTNIYDANNNLLSTTDPRGLTTKYTYDDRGNVTSKTDALGDTTFTTYNAFNYTTTITDALGRTATFLYNAAGNLIQTANPDGSTRSFSYDSTGRLIRLTDELGNTTSYAYASDPDPTLITNPDGSTQQRAYNAFGELTRQVDGNGNETDFTYDASGRLVSKRDALGDLTTYTYDAANHQISETDPLGGTTTFMYDAAGNRIRQTDALGGVTQYLYDADNRLVKQIDPLGNATVYTYNAVGELVSVRDPLGNVTSYQYDADRNETVDTDPNGHTFTIVYDALNRDIQETDALGGTQRYTYDAVGNKTSETDQDGHTTRFTYEALNRLVSQTDALGGLETFAYDALGDQIAVTDADGHTTTSSYDSMQRVVRQTDSAGYVTQIKYDANGNRIAVTDQDQDTTTYKYDALNRLVETTDPLGETQKYTYDAQGNQTSRTDGLGHATLSSYDQLNRLTSETDPDGNVTQYTYDAVGNRIALVDPLGQTTRFSYDADGRLIKQVDPLNQTQTMSYDGVGNLVQSTDGNGRTRQFTYDALDRLVKEAWVQGGTVVRTMTYTYDPAGNQLTAADPDSSYTFTYDELNRVTSVDNAGTPNVPHVVLHYTYDAAGNTIAVRDNLGVEVSSSYDPRNLLVSRTWQGTGISPARVDFSYNSEGELTQMTRSADLAGSQPVGSTVYQYDDADRVTSIQQQTATGTVLASYAYRYDAASNLSAETDNGQTTTYTYDPAGQLVASQQAGSAAQKYSYDANGNPSGGGYVVDPGNEVLSDGTYKYAYDGAGNLISKTDIASGAVTRYAYDFRNRLVSVEMLDASGKVLHQEQFIYDVFDRLIGRVVDGQATYTVYDHSNVWADFNASGTVVTHYLFGPQTDEILARQSTGGGTVWYLSDHLGSVRDLTDATGRVIDHIDYSPFGQVVGQTNAAASDRFLFTGREYDALSGLYYYRARFYDPVLGRFLSPDPLGFQVVPLASSQVVGMSPLSAPMGPLSAAKTQCLCAMDVRTPTGVQSMATNLYEYTDNEPTTFTDPTGKQLVASLGAQQSLTANQLGLFVVSGIGLEYAIACTYVAAITFISSVEGVELVVPPIFAMCAARTVKCTVKCQLVPTGQAGGGPPGATQYIYGNGVGPTKAIACKNAQKDANSRVPQGFYKRHCHTVGDP